MDAFSAKIKQYLNPPPDFIIFSYHGLPLKQVYRSHNNKDCQKYHCIHENNDNNTFCYQATCYHTTRLLAFKLGLDKDAFITCFQSRFAKNWLAPFTDEVIQQEAAKGNKNIVVISPSFVADCLENNVEIGMEYSDLFKQYGGKNLLLVESLNSDNNWIDAVLKIIC